MKCPVCGSLIIRQENKCVRIKDVTYVLPTTYVCERGHKFTKKKRKGVK